MGDISTWNPVDNANTAAPPDGWPEGQSPSSVNNCARAMMGAVRRWYDTVTAQLASLTTADSLRVLKAGDTMSGTLSAPQYNLSGVLFAGHAGTTNYVYDGTGVTAFELAATSSIYYADTHLFRSNNGALDTAYIDNVGNVHAVGNINADLDMGSRDFFASRNIWASTGTVTAAALVSTGAIDATGNITAPAFIGNVSIPAGGSISTTGTITGGDINGTGNITASNGILGRDIEASNTLLCGPGGSYFRADAGGTYNVSGAWIAFSDRAAKQEATIKPYKRGLDAIMALRPCAYRYRPELFGPEEAETTHYGLVADEVAPVVPEMVGEAVFGGRNLSTLNTGHISIVLINACRELAEQNAALAARITALEGSHV